MRVVQVKLQRQTESGVAEMTTWIDKKLGLGVGKSVSLKEDRDVFWNVIAMYGETDSSQLHRGWHVGGL